MAMNHEQRPALTFDRKSATTILLIGIFVAVRIAMRAAECLDGDEIFSFGVARQSWTKLWAASAYDVSHPPLFYALLKVWISVGGESLPWLRSFPTLTAIAALVPLWGLCSALGIRHEEKNLTLALMCLNGFVLFYSTQLRMFSLLLFASLCSLWAFARWLQTPSKGWRASSVLLIANMFVIYSHYWGWVLVGCQGLYLLAFAPRAIPKFTVIACILVITYIPWAVAVVQGAARKGAFTSQIEWITRPSVFDLSWFYYSLLGILPFRHTTLLGLALSGAPVILWARSVIYHRERCEAFQFLMWFAILPTILTFAASLVLKQSVWAERSLIICAVPYMILISVAACRLPGKTGVAVPLALFAWAVVSGVHYLSQPHRLPWESLATQIARAESGANAPVPIYAVEDFVAGPLQFFSAEQGTTRKLKIQRIDPKDIVQISDQHFWIVYREFGGKVWRIDRRPEDILASKRYRFGGVVEIGRESMSIRAVPVMEK